MNRTAHTLHRFLTLPAFFLLLLLFSLSGCNSQQGTSAVPATSSGWLSGAGTDTKVLARVEVPESLADINLPIYETLEGADGVFYALVIATEQQLQASGATYRVLTIHRDGTDYLIGESTRAGSHLAAAKATPILYDDGYWILVTYKPDLEDTLADLGFDLKMMYNTPMQVTPKGKGLEQLKAAGTGSLNSRAYTPLTVSSTVKDLIGKVTSGDFESYIKDLSGENSVTLNGPPVTKVKLSTRHTNSGSEISNALAYVKQELEKSGRFTIKTESWTRIGRNPWENTSKEFTCSNLWADLPGTGDNKGQVIVVIAHLDSVAEGSETNPAPGADDDGSGCAAMLTIAKVLGASSATFDRTIRFVFTTGEEQGVLGGFAAADLFTPKETISGLVNMDMIAYHTNSDSRQYVKIRVPADPGYVLDKEISDLYLAVVSSYGLSSITPVVSPDGEANSDQDPFWKKKVPGIWVIEDDIYNFNSTNMHSNLDRLDKLTNPAYYTSMVKAVLGTAAHMAYPK